MTYLPQVVLAFGKLSVALTLVAIVARYASTKNFRNNFHSTVFHPIDRVRRLF